MRDHGPPAFSVADERHDVKQPLDSVVAVYQRFPPADELSGVVERYWMTGATSPNSAVLFGITTRPYVLSQTGTSRYVGAELKPWGVAALVHVSGAVRPSRRPLPHTA